VFSAMTTVFGSAIPWRRAARFGVSPTMPRSCASPEPMRSLDGLRCRGSSARLFADGREQYPPMP
jgi:hypothetical protein